MRPFRLQPDRATENDIEAPCLRLMWRRGYWRIRLHAGRFKTPDDRWLTGVDKGTPDWAFMHARFPGVLVEVKRPGAKLRPEQLAKIQEIAKNYHLAIAVVDDPHQLLTWLDAHESRFRTSPENPKPPQRTPSP